MEKLIFFKNSRPEFLKEPMPMSNLSDYVDPQTVPRKPACLCWKCDRPLYAYETVYKAYGNIFCEDCIASLIKGGAGLHIDFLDWIKDEYIPNHLEELMNDEGIVDAWKHVNRKFLEAEQLDDLDSFIEYLFTADVHTFDKYVEDADTLRADILPEFRNTMKIQLESAYDAARAAGFEHGETPF